jgi:hypothetical protein
MLIKKELDSSKVERDIIAQMIINTEFLQKMSQIYEKNSLKMSYTNTLADICVNYYKQHEQAPGKHIQDLFDGIVRIDPDQKGLIKSFLISINKMIQDYEPDELYNSEFHFKMALDHLTDLNITRLREEITNLQAGKDYEKIEALLKDFKSIKRKHNPARDALTDKEFVVESFDADKGSILFELPGAIGELFGPIRRKGSYMIQADTGVGKSWILSFIGLCASLSGVTTLLLPLEMDEYQTNLRVQHMLSGQCLYKEKEDVLFIPVWDCYYNLTGECPRAVGISQEITISHKTKNRFEERKKFVLPTSRQFDQYSHHSVCTDCKGRLPSSGTPGYKPSTWFRKILAEYADAYKSISILDTIQESSNRMAPLYIDGYERQTLSIDGYDANLHNLFHYENKAIQLGIIDYADEMVMEGSDERLGINRIHGGIKKISQHRNMANISASQENDEGKSFGSRKKMHLIDGGIRIMQTPEEKARGLYRFESIKQRFGKGTKGQILHVTQCLEIGKPILEEYWDIKI